MTFGQTELVLPVWMTLSTSSCMLNRKSMCFTNPLHNNKPFKPLYLVYICNVKILDCF